MARIDPTRLALDRLRALEPVDSPTLRLELGKALGNKSAFVVKKAAQMVAQAGVLELTDAMVAAFERLKGGGASADPGCDAKTAVLHALCQLEASRDAFYLANLDFVQLDPGFGTPEETAGRLRGLCGLGLVRCRHPFVLEALTQLLVDPKAQARLLAVQAVGESGEPGAIPLLRLKAATEEEGDVLLECLVTLLALAPERTIPWLEKRYLARRGETWELAVLALGQCRRQEALQTLLGQERPSLLEAERKALYLAIASCRVEGSVDFLIARMSEHPEPALAALEIYRSDEAVWERVEEARAQSR